MLTDQRALQILEKLLQSGHTLDSLQGEIRISSSEEYLNFSVISLKRDDLSVDTTVNPPLFSLVNTYEDFKARREATRPRERALSSFKH